MLVPSWVLLGLEECVKIPEGTLNEVVSWHFRETGKSVKKQVECS